MAGGSLVLILAAVVCGVLGQIALKLGMTQIGRIGAEAMSQPLQVAITTLSNPLVIGGLGFYAIGAAAWLTVLSRVPLSYAYPLLATTYAITPVVAWLTLNESVSLFGWAGILTICIGVILVSRS